MKSTKKLLALLLSALLLLSLLPAAFASEVQPDAGAGDTTGEVTPPTDTQKFHLTITNTYPKHVFDLYQVFTGTLHTETTQTDKGETTIRYLSDIKFGSAWTNTPGDISTIVEEFEANTADPAANWDLLFNKNGGTLRAWGTQTCAAGATSVTFSDLPAGYYIAREVTPAADMGEGVTYSSVIVQVVESVSVASKHGTASSQKKVKDTNDSVANSTTGWQDSADYDIGDMVPFQLTAVVGSDYAKYSKERGYSLTFYDHESKGLTFDSTTVKAYVVNGSDDPVAIDAAQYTVSAPTNRADGSHDFTIKFTNLKNITAVEASSKIVVEYESRLNENAKIGSEGNPNEMYIKFSNNPNSDESEEGGITPDDKVIVFTYQFEAWKGNEDQLPLEGADFELFKQDASGKYTISKGKITFEQAVGDAHFAENVKFIYRFTGLDDGNYKLVETKAPSGYNTAEDFYFTISAQHDENSDSPKLTDLNFKYKDKDGVDKLMQATMPDGLGKTMIQNFRGNTLPSTGGMGTTIFYVLGSILAVGAAILLVSKKRMNGAR